MTSKAALPFPTEFDIQDLPKDPKLVLSTINMVLKPLHAAWEWEEGESQSRSGVFRASQDVWSRSFRRKLARNGDEHALPEGNPDVDEAAYVARVGLGAAPGCIAIRWLKGSDHVVFESFCTMMKREMAKGFGTSEAPPGRSKASKGISSS